MILCYSLCLLKKPCASQKMLRFIMLSFLVFTQLALTPKRRLKLTVMFFSIMKKNFFFIPFFSSSVFVFYSFYSKTESPKALSYRTVYIMLFYFKLSSWSLFRINSDDL
jgi:hypothetical protein